jgi:hypothetical protein
MPNRRDSASRALPDELYCYLADQQVEKTADYLRNGRRLAKLRNRELADAWVSVMEKLADEPIRKKWRRVEEELSCELDLRGLEPPWERVRYALDRYRRTACMLIQEWQEHPEVLKRANAEFEEQFSVYGAKRAQPKH